MAITKADGVRPATASFICGYPLTSDATFLQKATLKSVHLHRLKVHQLVHRFAHQYGKQLNAS